MISIATSKFPANVVVLTIVCLVALASSAALIGQDEDPSSPLIGSSREIRAAFMNHRLSTARGFGKRLVMPSSALLEELRRLRFRPEFAGSKRGFRRNRISTARGFGKRSSAPLEESWNSESDPEFDMDKRAFRRLQTARGFGKRTNTEEAESVDYPAVRVSGGDWVKEPPSLSNKEES